MPDLRRRSWVDSANNSEADFPIQNWLSAFFAAEIVLTRSLSVLQALEAQKNLTFFCTRRGGLINPAVPMAPAGSLENGFGFPR
jgi:hypothetical protein